MGFGLPCARAVDSIQFFCPCSPMGHVCCQWWCCVPHHQPPTQVFASATSAEVSAQTERVLSTNRYQGREYGHFGQGSKKCQQAEREAVIYFACLEDGRVMKLHYYAALYDLYRSVLLSCSYPVNSISCFEPQFFFAEWQGAPSIVAVVLSECYVHTCRVPNKS